MSNTQLQQQIAGEPPAVQADILAILTPTPGTAPFR